MSAPGRVVERRTFWPTALLGLIGACVAAWAGHHPWIKAAANDPFSQAQGNVDSPGITALALVALAAWGVILVTRGLARRLVAMLGLVAAGAPVPAIWGTRHHLLSTHDGSHGTAWPWVSLVALVVTFLSFVVAVMKSPVWPEMGAKYDAPTGATSTAPLEEQSSIDLWKSLDEGTDPTVGPATDPTHESE
ncbi:Trp biosynthesis-associated membrane protein [Nocardioides nematodiphilus]|uniref:Trp biosynthesis-associated membrane protein n=1 Tax=Nocardioides nematodiphilus TaxID=2849669 RepID=UPI001CD99B0E|nr:Trp biosynthesis-associated membrane protein [Nocardioides nematodiphilus]MCA1982523.1 Trp biosynthesis-associated membrane protein [Nocardioides nematodiphilus]